MWIFDSYYKGCVELWSRERGLERIGAAYPPSFYKHLKDPHAYWEMTQALESRFRVEECRFNTIFGFLPGPQDIRQQKSGREDRDTNPLRCRALNKQSLKRIEIREEYDNNVRL